MKIRFSICLATLSLAATLATSVQVAAQGEPHPKGGKHHHHYQLIDIGTFGGPNSNVPLDPSVQQPLSAQGTVAGCADTSIPDPNYLNSNPVIPQDPFIEHEFQWKNGVLTDLGALPGINSSCTAGIAISGNGLIIGASENGTIDPLTGWPEVQAVLWKNDQIINLGTLGGNESFSIGVNNRGQVTGQAANAIPDPFPFPGFGQQARAFLWQNGVMLDLGTLGGPDAFGIAINDRGQVLGFSYINSTPNPTTGLPTGDGFLWEHGTLQDIPDPLGGTIVSPFYLNNRGQVVGDANLAGDIHVHPFLWAKGVFTDLGTFGGSDGVAQVVNEAGQVVGTANLAGDTTFYGFLWKKGVIRALVPVVGDTCSQTYGMNSQGEVVGWSATAPSNDCINNPLTTIRAVLWGKDGSVVDLNTLIPSNSGIYLFAATNINDRGEIVGEGLLPNGDGHAFLLTPCDENHPGVEGCDYSMVDTTAAAQSAAPRYVPSETQRPPQSRWTHRYQLPGYNQLAR